MKSLCKTFIVLAFIVAPFCFSSNSKAEEERIITPENLIQAFYKSILSDSSLSECPDIFYSGDSFVAILPDNYRNQMQKGKTNAAIIWEYLRDNKGLFLFPTVAPNDTISRLKISYIFSNFPDNDVFFEGKLSVLLMAPLSPKGRDGVVKEVIFSLEKNPGPYQPRYLLNLHSTRVNGIYLEPSYNQYRTGNLYHQLGFPVGGSD